MGIDEKTLKKLKKRAATVAGKNRWLLGDACEDFVQEYMLMLVTKGWRQTPDQAVIDFIRKRFGRTGVYGNSSRKDREEPYSDLAAAYRQSIDQNDSRDNSEYVGRCLDIERVVENYGGYDRAVFLLKFKWGLTNDEIGYCFGVTGSRICQKYKRMEKRIQEDLQKEIPPRKPRSCETKKQSTIPQEIQTRPRVQSETIGKLENVPEKEGQRMGKGEVEKVSKAVLRTFGVNTF